MTPRPLTAQADTPLDPSDDSPPMRYFMARVGCSGPFLPVRGRTSLCVVDSLMYAAHGRRVEVMTLEAWNARMDDAAAQRAADDRALALQLRHPGELERAMWGGLQ